MTNDSTNLPHDPPQAGATAYTGQLPSGDILGSATDDGPKRRLGWAGAAGAGALVLALVGGVTYGFAALSGGGAHPDEALPSGAFAYAELDLDPSAGQKVDGFRFMRQFPELAKQLKDDDLRRSLFEAMASEVGWEEIDYEKDVEPWLGERLAVAAYPPKQFGGSADADDDPTVVVALQVADEGAAKEGLDRLAAASADDSDVGGGGVGGNVPGFVIEGGYALLAESAAIAESARDAATDGPLSADEDFAADMSAMDDGVASIWIDTDAATKAMGGFGAPFGLSAVTTTSGASGRASFVVRFDGADTLELAGRVADAEAVADIAPATLTGMADLPAGSVAALGLAGGEDMVDPAWDSLRKQMGADALESIVTEAKRELDVTLPDDLRTLLGSNLLVALDAEGLDAGDPSVGARVTTDPDQARSLLDRLTPMLEAGLPSATVETTDDGYVVASNAATAARLSDLGSGSTLGGDEDFTRALPDLDGARFAVWVDLDTLLATLAVDDENAEPLAGVGLTASYEGSSGEFRLRLVTK